MTSYVGLDVGLRSTSLCIVDSAGAVQLESSVASEVDDIARAIRSTDVEVEAIALETGNLTPWLAAALRGEGFKVVVLDARQVKTTLSSLRNKTDRNDARGIAQIVRTGWYREVHVKTPESQRLKTLLAARKALSRRHIDLENEIRGLMKVYGRKLTERVRHGKFDGAVRDVIAGDDLLVEALEPLLDARMYLYRAFLELDRRVKALAFADPICQLLMSAPGVGYVAALTFKAGQSPHGDGWPERPARQLERIFAGAATSLRLADRPQGTLVCLSGGQLLAVFQPDAELVFRDRDVAHLELDGRGAGSFSSI